MLNFIYLDFQLAKKILVIIIVYIQLPNKTSKFIDYVSPVKVEFKNVNYLCLE